MTYVQGPPSVRNLQVLPTSYSLLSDHTYSSQIHGQRKETQDRNFSLLNCQIFKMSGNICGILRRI